jgi:two-component system phosphate regulon sensor histidine kinase PhoR
MRKSQFPWRIVLMEIVLMSASLGAGGIAVRQYLKQDFVEQVQTQARGTLKALSVDLPAVLPSDWCALHARGTDFRLTVIALDGSVLCDSHADPATMENHSDRPEIIAALKEGYGQSLRPSVTLRENMLYSALRVKGHGLLLREAIFPETLSNALTLFDVALWTLLSALAAIFALLIFWAGKNFATPMQRLILKASGQPNELLTTEGIRNELGEWSDLESALDRIQSDLLQKTEQLSREREELATLMSAISDAILAVDLEGSPLFFNSRFVLLFGGKDFQARKPRLGETFRAPEILRAYHGVFSEGRTQNVDLLLHAAGDTVPRDYSLAVAPLHRGDGTVYGAVGIFHDVTELKRAEKIRIDFVANVSHELRTPLTAIKGYADTLREDISQQRFDSAEKFLGIILKNVDRLMSLIRDLLDLSWLESSQGEEGMVKSRIQTQELTERALLQLESRRAQKNHTIETRYDARELDGDAPRVEQVVINLVENAIKYTPAGGKIRVAWEKLPGTVRLTVSDNGPGIAPEHYPRLFERFYRVDQARSREVGGTGLGLAIVKHIMQRHGGAISVSADSSGGTKFTCLFPYPED